MNRFKSMFDVVSKENADATTIPVVLELDVQPAEGSADVAADPATEPATTAAATTEPAAAEGEDLGQGEVEEEGEATAVELAEAEAEHNELMNEIEVVEDVAEKVEADAADVKEALDANDKAVAEGKEEVITPANVAIATQSFELRLERLGLSLTDLCPSANISKETFISKEEGGLGMKPSEVLRNLHNEISREDGVLDKIKAGAKKVWDAIIAALKKIVDVISKLLPTQKNRLSKLNDTLENVKVSSVKVDVGSIAPAYSKYKREQAADDIIKSLDASIAANNKVIEKANKKEDATDETIKKIYDEAFSALPVVDGERVVAVHRFKVFIVDKEGKIVTRNIAAEKSEVQLKAEEITGFIEDMVEIEASVSSRIQEYKKVIKNLEQFTKVNDSKIQAWWNNYKIKHLYGTLYKAVVKEYPDMCSYAIALGNALAKADKEANK